MRSLTWGLHKYQGNHFSPKGTQVYPEEFDCENIPTTTYRVGGVILQKEKIFRYIMKFEFDPLYLGKMPIRRPTLRVPSFPGFPQCA